MSAEHWGYRTIGIVKGNRESFHPKHTMYPTDAGVTPSAGSDKWCTKWVNAETQPHIEKGIQEEFPDSERQLIVWREQVWHFFFFPCPSVFLLSKLWDCFLTPSGCSVSRQSLEHYSSKPLISSTSRKG